MHACTPVAGAKTLFKLIRTVAATSKSFKLSCVYFVALLNLFQSEMYKLLAGNNSERRDF